MTGQDLDRRTLMAAALAACAPVPALAQRSNRAFTDGPLARNRLARYFEPVPEGTAWPPTDFLSSGGRRPISHYRGKTLIVQLWSEICPPCLAEMPVFAQLSAQYGGEKFEIVPVVTGSKRLNTMARAQKFLTDRKIGMATLIDGGRGGDELLRTVAASPNEPKGALPCNLLIDRDGRLRARQTGYVLEFPASAQGKPPAEQARLARSIWEGPDAAQFFEVLKSGQLG